jgi:hypothetical protein
MASWLVSHRFGLAAISESYHLPSLPPPLAEWIVVAMAILFAVTVPLPDEAAPRRLQVRERFGQLFISWTPGLGGRLDINDGGLLTTLSISRHLASVTYTRHSKEVEIRLEDPEARTAPQLARFITSRDSIEIAALDQQINGLIMETRHLRLIARNQRSHIQLIQMSANLLLDRIALVARRMHIEKQSGTPNKIQQARFAGAR